MADKAQVSLQEAVEARIQEGYQAAKRIRKDTVKALGNIRFKENRVGKYK
ncbi:MAG: hypothetical protein MI674_00880 [Cytophagales bacterium]|nr:hypothetical protein [Cytophagales bacterium]